MNLDEEAERQEKVNLHGTLDAGVWAREFCRYNPRAEFENMRIWFANAIMAGYDYGKGPINGSHAEFMLNKEPRP